MSSSHGDTLGGDGLAPETACHVQRDSLKRIGQLLQTSVDWSRAALAQRQPPTPLPQAIIIAFTTYYCGTGYLEALLRRRHFPPDYARPQARRSFANAIRDTSALPHRSQPISAHSTSRSTAPPTRRRAHVTARCPSRELGGATSTVVHAERGGSSCPTEEDTPG